jgi:peptidylprolyl isomerase
MPPLRRAAVLLALLAALAATGCGADEEGTAESTQPADPQTETSPAQTEADLKDMTSKPLIPKPTGAPPRKLVKQDIVKGKGRVANPGENVTVRYVGITFSTGEEFDTSWDGAPFSFTLGAGKVIPGWDKGIAGMRKGGRRQLTIPPEQAYGAEGAPPEIGPNETLVYVIDLVSID